MTNILSNEMMKNFLETAVTISIEIPFIIILMLESGRIECGKIKDYGLLRI